MIALARYELHYWAVHYWAVHYWGARYGGGARQWKTSQPAAGGDEKPQVNGVLGKWINQMAQHESDNLLVNAVRRSEV